MCSHANVLDDLEVGDEVCTDCGLVLGRIIGQCRRNHDGSGGIIVKSSSAATSQRRGRRVGGEEEHREEGEEGEEESWDGGVGGGGTTAMSSATTRRPEWHCSWEVKREEMIGILGVYRMDAGCNVWRAMDLYNKLYHSRIDKIRMTESMCKTATAFAICQTMIENGSPRCQSEVCKMCGLESDAPLLNIPIRLRLGEDEMQRLVKVGLRAGTRQTGGLH